MIGGDVPLNVNFALSRPKPVVATGAVFSRNVTNALFASRLLQSNILLLTMFINWTKWCLDVSHDRGFKRINKGIELHSLHAAYSVRWVWGCGRYMHVTSSVATGLLKISPDLGAKIKKKQIKKKVQTSKYLRN